MRSGHRNDNYEILIEIGPRCKLNITLFASIFDCWIFRMFNCFVSSKSFLTVWFVITLITFIFNWPLMHPYSMLFQILFLWKTFSTVLANVGLFDNFLTRCLFRLNNLVLSDGPPVHGQTYRSAEPFLIDFLDVSFYVFLVSPSSWKRNCNQLHRK